MLISAFYTAGTVSTMIFCMFKRLAVVTLRGNTFNVRTCDLFLCAKIVLIYGYLCYWLPILNRPEIVEENVWIHDAYIVHIYSFYDLYQSTRVYFIVICREMEVSNYDDETATNAGEIRMKFHVFVIAEKLKTLL